MLTISVTLLHGLLRATTADDTALTGAGGEAEWPPSPARLFAALVAGGGTGNRVPTEIGDKGLRALEGAVPTIHASAPSRVLTSGVNDRYVVIDERADGSVQEYPGRSAQRVSPGTRVAPYDVDVIYTWPEVELDDAELAALRFRAARVPYIGCADSPAVVRVSADPPSATLPRWVPDPAGSVSLPVPPEGYLAQLDSMYAAWSSGERVRRAWLMTPHSRYRTPDEVEAPIAESATVLWTRFDRAVQQRRTVQVADALRSAVLARVEAALGGRDAIPEVLHGHLSLRGPGQHSIRWLPLPTVAAPHADGRIRGAAVWLPPGCPPDVIEVVREALARVEELTVPGAFSSGIRPFDGTTRPWTSHPARWTGPSRRWVSVTPVIHERHTHAALTMGDIIKMCDHAGAPAPTAFRQSPVPLAHGSVMIPAREMSRGGRLQGAHSFIELGFGEPVRGPIALGKGRGFGIGLFAPLRDQGGRA